MQVGKEEEVSATAQFALLGTRFPLCNSHGEGQKYLLSYRAHFTFWLEEFKAEN